MIQLNSFTKQTLNLWLPRGRLEVSRCKLLYIEWINKILPYSTGNYIQYSVINHDGKEYEKECLMESFCCTVEINTTL